MIKKTIPLKPVGYEVITTNLTLCALLVINHIIANTTILLKKLLQSHSPIPGSSGMVIPCLILLIKYSLSRPAYKNNAMTD